MLAVTVVAIAAPVRRARARKRTARELAGDGGGVRERVDDWLRARGRDPLLLIDAPTDLGDTYRALRSLLDAASRQRMEVSVAEITERVYELMRTIPS